MAKTNKNANYVTEKTQVAQNTRAKVKSSQKTKEITKQVLIISAIVIAIAGLITGFVFALIGCTKPEPRQFKAPIEGAFEVTDVVELEFEGYGTVTIELYGKEAPKTVANFLELVKEGKISENTLSFSSSTYDKKLTVTLDHDHEEEGHSDLIKGEYYDSGWANKISHVTGVLTMAKSGYSSSANSFMILLNDHSGETDVTNDYNTTTKYGYDGNYAAFGKVTGGTLTVIEKMQADYNETASSSSSSTKAEDELVFGSNSKTVSSEDITKGTVEYKFTPDATGKYTFTSSTFKSLLVDIANKEGGAAEGAKSILGEEKDQEALKLGVEYELEKGVEYKIVLGVQDLTSGTKRIVISGDIVFEGTNDVEILEDDVKNESKSFEFTANMTGVYTFAGKEDIKGKIEIFDGTTSIGTNTAYLVKDKTYTVIVNTKNVEADDYELTITPPTLVLGDNALSIPEYVLKDGKATYYFTPSEDGKYLVANKKLTITVYNANGDKLEGDYLDLKKDETYVIELVADLSASVYVGENVISITAEDKKADSQEHVKKYSFVAEKTGKYTFTADGIEFTIYNGTTALKATEGKYELTSGKTYTVEFKTVEAKDYALTIAVDDGATDEKINHVSYTVTVQDTVLSVGTNTQTITKAEIEAEKTVFTFTATTNGPISFTSFYQKLDENGEQIKNESGGLSYINSIVKVYDKDGNELDAKYAVLVKGEMYTVEIMSKNIKPSAVCTIKIAKVLPKLTGAKIVEK